MFSICVLLNKATAQAPPAINWQKCFGGSEYDAINSIQQLKDGSFIMAGETQSSDGDITKLHGGRDAWVMKTDVLGNLLWQKSYGGSFADNARDIKATAEGGYILLGNVSSNDGDVSGNHGASFDVWLAKLDADGNIQWQKCFGSAGQDNAYTVQQTTDGGYIIGAHATMNGGDVTGHHGNTTANDIWIIKTDNNGNIQWEKCYGGSGSDDITSVIQTTDGGYFFSATIESTDGDVNCSHYENEDAWLVKLDNNGKIQWQNCIGGNYGEGVNSLLQTRDGGYITAGFEFSDDLPGTYGQGGDGWVVKFDAAGNVEWQRFLGGTQSDELKSIIETNDGYAVVGNSNSVDGEICTNRGNTDLFIIKLNKSGATLWKRTCGGLANDGANAVAETTDGGFMVSGFTYSNDGDVIGNHSNGSDAWLVKLSFPGIDILPTIQIAASENNICANKSVTFTSVITNGGTNPQYQWLINGQSFSKDSVSTVINTLKNGDVVSCILTSNSGCVTDTTGISNTIPVSVNSLMTPVNFLPATLEICPSGNLEIKPTTTYKSYLWNTGETLPAIIVNHQGLYWLQVVNNSDCPGRDTVTVIPKDCVAGFYMPSAFTPNNDGKNDLFKPIIGGVLVQYKLVIYNRWGQAVFQTTDHTKGWDGKTGNTGAYTQSFAWFCTYQFRDEAVKTVKGNVTLIR